LESVGAVLCSLVATASTRVLLKFSLQTAVRWRTLFGFASFFLCSALLLPRRVLLMMVNYEVFFLQISKLKQELSLEQFLMFGLVILIPVTVAIIWHLGVNFRKLCVLKLLEPAPNCDKAKGFICAADYESRSGDDFYIPQNRLDPGNYSLKYF
jgi:hypothetical protein